MHQKKKIMWIAAICLLFTAAGVWYVFSAGKTAEKDSPAGIFQISPTVKEQSEKEQSVEKNSMESSFTDDTAKETVTSEAKDTVTATQTTCAVFICGEVQFPGVYEVAPKSRLYELVELAGGFTEEADRTYHNLARTVADGERVYILSTAETGLLAEAERIAGEPEAPWEEAGAEQTGGSAEEKRVNINSADLAELETLPGIGKAKAERILEYRQTVGNFTAVEEIMNVSGIGEAMFEKIKNKITVR